MIDTERFNEQIVHIGYNYELVLFDCELECTYGEFVREFAEETTSPRGVETVYHLREDEVDEEDSDDVQLWRLYSWGILGQNLHEIKVFETEEEATFALLETFEVDMHNSCEGFIYANSREELSRMMSEDYEKEYVTMEQQEELLAEKRKMQAETDAANDQFDTDCLVYAEKFIADKSNQGLIAEKTSELDSLKLKGDQQKWHIAANTLVQLASNGMVTGSTWKDVYSMIRAT